MRARKIAAAALIALGVAWAPASLAQTTTYEVKQGEVVKVKGNDLVVKTPEGYRAFNIPDDFRFQTEAGSLSVHELKPGMKLTAAIATTRTPVQIVTTELRNAEVLNANGMSVVVKDQDGVQKIFTKEDFDGMGLALYKEGQPATSFDLRKGDRITALIMKEGPPLVLEEKRVAAVAQNPPPPPAKAMPVAATTAQAAPPPPAPKTLPKTASSWPVVGFAGVALVGLGLGLTLLRRLM
jgi:hypothetical protein